MENTSQFDQTIGSAGESLSLTIPKATCIKLNLKKGDIITVIVTKGE